MLGTLIHAPGCGHGRAPVDGQGKGAGPASPVQPAEGPRVEVVQKLWEIRQCRQLLNLGRKYVL